MVVVNMIKLTKQRLTEIIREELLMEKDKEGKMAKYDAKETYEDAIEVFKMIDEYDDLPEWLEAKITKASDYMNSVKDYLQHHHSGKNEGKLTEGKYFQKWQEHLKNLEKLYMSVHHAKKAIPHKKKELMKIEKHYKELHKLIPVIVGQMVDEGKLTEGKESIFDVAIRVMKDKQMYVYQSKKGKVKVDMQTANLLTQVWKKVNPKMKKILSDLGEKNPAQLVQTLRAVVK